MTKRDHEIKFFIAFTLTLQVLVLSFFYVSVTIFLLTLLVIIRKFFHAGSLRLLSIQIYLYLIMENLYFNRSNTNENY